MCMLHRLVAVLYPCAAHNSNFRYAERVVEVDSLSGQLDNACALCELGLARLDADARTPEVCRLLMLQQHIMCLMTLVYDCGLCESSSLYDWVKMDGSDKLAVALSGAHQGNIIQVAKFCPVPLL